MTDGDDYREALARRLYLMQRTNELSWWLAGAAMRQHFRREADEEARLAREADRHGYERAIKEGHKVSDQLVDAIARCLAKIEGPFIGAADWAGATGDSYRDKARQVLRTIDNFDKGIRSGGLPPRSRP